MQRRVFSRVSDSKLKTKQSWEKKIRSMQEDMKSSKSADSSVVWVWPYWTIDSLIEVPSVVVRPGQTGFYFCH